MVEEETSCIISFCYLKYMLHPFLMGWNVLSGGERGMQVVFFFSVLIQEAEERWMVG